MLKVAEPFHGLNAAEQKSSNSLLTLLTVVQCFRDAGNSMRLVARHLLLLRDYKGTNYSAPILLEKGTACTFPYLTCASLSQGTSSEEQLSK
jgi:hypothetical protein